MTDLCTHSQDGNTIDSDDDEEEEDDGEEEEDAGRKRKQPPRAGSGAGPSGAGKKTRFELPSAKAGAVDAKGKGKKGKDSKKRGGKPGLEIEYEREVEPRETNKLAW